MPSFLGMNYVASGAGSCVLLLHGWGSDLTCWNRVRAELEDDFEVFAIDFWGFGQSELPKESAGIYDYAEAIKQFVEKVIRKPVCIVGHSFGGRVALILAGKCSFVSDVVLVDSAGLRPKLTLKQKRKQNKYKKMKAKVLAGEVDESELNKFGSKDYKALNAVMRGVFIRVVNEDLTSFARKVTQRTLLIWGRSDKDTPMYMAHKFRKLIKRSELVTLNGGHFSFIDDHNAFMRAVYNFIK